MKFVPGLILLEPGRSRLMEALSMDYNQVSIVESGIVDSAFLTCKRK